MSNIFEPDELNKVSPKGDWTLEKILSTKGIFHFKNITKILGLTNTRLNHEYNVILKNGTDPYREMGVKKVWNKWVIRMLVFAPYYKDHLKKAFDPVPKGWDANTVVRQKLGVYRLIDICNLLPLTYSQVRRQARKMTDPKTEIGIWKDTDEKVMLVDLTIFSPWLKSACENNFKINKK